MLASTYIDVDFHKHINCTSFTLLAWYDMTEQNRTEIQCVTEAEKGNDK